MNVALAEDERGVNYGWEGLGSWRDRKNIMGGRDKEIVMGR